MGGTNDAKGSDQKMSYQKNNLSVLAYAGGFTLWHYRNDADDADSMLAPGYFDGAATMVRKGDIIIANSAGGAAFLHCVDQTQRAVHVVEVACGVSGALSPDLI